jgi:hypothetical protein
LYYTCFNFEDKKERVLFFYKFKVVSIDFYFISPIWFCPLLTERIVQLQTPSTMKKLLKSSLSSIRIHLCTSIPNKCNYKLLFKDFVILASAIGNNWKDHAKEVDCVTVVA